MGDAVEANYTIFAKTKDGRAYIRGGRIELARIEEGLHDVITNILFFVLAAFIANEFDGDDGRLENLSCFTFEIEDLKFGYGSRSE